MTPLEFADALRSYCLATGGSVTSYGRSPAHNKAVGGLPDSAHLLWLAADIVYDAPIDPTLKSRIADRVGLHRIPEKGNVPTPDEAADHDHLQPA